MEIIALVVKTEQGKADVMILRTSACGHSCETCGACAGKEHIITVADPIGVQQGENVTVRVADRAPLTDAFFVYLFPILASLLCCGIIAVAVDMAWAWAGLIPALFVWMIVLFIRNKKRAKAGVYGIISGRAKKI